MTNRLINFAIFLLQLRTTYPENMFLIPVIWLALIIAGLGILVALFIALTNRAIHNDKRDFSKTSGTPDNFVLESEPEYFVVVGQHEIPIDKAEAKTLRRKNFTVVER